MTAPYKFLAANCVMNVATRRAIYLDQPATIHAELYLAWVAEGNVADPADPVVPPAPPTTDQIRGSELDAVISADSTVAALKAMNATEFDTWWAANVTSLAQANNVLKRLARIVIRRLA